MGYVFLMFGTVVGLIWLAGYLTGARKPPSGELPQERPPWRW
jgi:hypothetical protein